MKKLPTDAEITEIACSGCGRPLGRTSSVSPVPRLFCSSVCQEDWPISQNEDRDDLIFQLLHFGETKGKIASAVGLSRQRIIQLAHQREKEGVLAS